MNVIGRLVEYIKIAMPFVGNATIFVLAPPISTFLYVLLSFYNKKSKMVKGNLLNKYKLMLYKHMK